MPEKIDEKFNIAHRFFTTSAKYPENLALLCGSMTKSYAELWRDASQLAAYLQPRLKKQRVGILASRSIMAYVGILGAAVSGATYVPLNLKWPEERLIALMNELELDALIVDQNGVKLLSDSVRAHAPTVIITSDDAIGVKNSIRTSQLPDDFLKEPVKRDPSELGYIIFTSGSTGMPKGVMVSCASLACYINESDKWTKLRGDDKIAEAHDITFDLSVHNMFSAWRQGAALFLMSQLDMMAPHSFIRKHEISVWMSVPTIVNNMRHAKRLYHGLLPSLRLSIFCGEPLSIKTVEAWADAAPNSVIENIYGPTECTVVCTRQRLTKPPIVTQNRGILAIGQPYDNFEIAICGEDGAPLPDGKTGEIALASDQLSIGYFNAQKQTEKAFRRIDDKIWYYTGDLGYRDENGILHHIGRADNQVKMKGNRIELEEVESHLRRVCQNELATVVAWPIIDSVPQGLVGFTTNKDMPEATIQRILRKSLPDYMVPGQMVFKKEMPRNNNDKIDRQALLRELDVLSKVDQTTGVRSA